MYKYSATQWIFGNENIESSLKRLKKYGYDGVELAGEPYTMDMDRIQRLLQQYEMVCTSICGIYTPERDLSSPNPSTRADAVQYVKDCLDMADRLGAALVIVVPTFVGKTSPGSTVGEEWGNAVASLKEVGEYARTKQARIALEALNRFETYLVNNLETAYRLAEQVNIDGVHLMADLFHMNIEERDHVTALKRIEKHLIHVHIADNTREAAGFGQIDFKPILATLAEIGYQGSITMEFLPPVANPYLAAQRESSSEIFDQYAERSIHEIKRIVETIA